VSLNHGVSLRFVSLPALWALWATFQAKNVRNASASTALAQVLHWSHNVCTTNCHLHGSGERNGAQRRTKVSFGRIMMHWSYCGWRKGTFQDEAMSNSAKIHSIALVVIKLRLSEGISKWVCEWVSEWVSQSVSRKFN